MAQTHYCFGAKFGPYTPLMQYRKFKKPIEKYATLGYKWASSIGKDYSCNH
jgi:hypothetical protein